MIIQCKTPFYFLDQISSIKKSEEIFCLQYCIEKKAKIAAQATEIGFILHPLEGRNRYKSQFFLLKIEIGYFFLSTTMKLFGNCPGFNIC